MRSVAQIREARIFRELAVIEAVRAKMDAEAPKGQGRGRHRKTCSRCGEQNRSVADVCVECGQAFRRSA